MNSTMKIEIWSDVMCPFCYIGKRNFEAAIDQFQHKDTIEVEWKSFQLDPSLPEKPAHQDNLYQFFSEYKGVPYEQSVQMHQNLVQSAKAVGLEYNFDKAKITNSFKAHRIIQFAKTKGLGDKAEERFFKAYFTEGKNVSDAVTLLQLGKEIGLTEDEVNEALTNPVYKTKVEEEVKEAQHIGVSGVPFFVIDRKYGVVGAQPAAVILQNIEKAYSEWEK
jgi:predicted DsbA family dithiol-disulfide isomerase